MADLRPVRTDISPGTYFLAALALMVLPVKLFICAVCAAAFHELCHILMLKICSVRINHIHIGVSGAEISTGSMHPFQEILCAAAGPLGSLALLVFIRVWPMLSIFGVFQGIFNLLPIFPLDGGRIIKAILDFILPYSSQKIMRCLETGIILALMLWILLAQAAVLWMRILLVFLLLRLVARKCSCKEHGMQVQ